MRVRRVTGMTARAALLVPLLALLRKARRSGVEAGAALE